MPHIRVIILSFLIENQGEKEKQYRQMKSMHTDAWPI